MSSKQDKTAPVLPFDITYGENLSMYDKMAYERNLALAGNDMIKMESGNVIKFFRCAASQTCNIGGDIPKDAPASISLNH